MAMLSATFLSHSRTFVTRPSLSCSMLAMFQVLVLLVVVLTAFVPATPTQAGNHARAR